MVIGKATSQRPYNTKEASVNITVEDTLVQQVSDFTYLGQLFPATALSTVSCQLRFRKLPEPSIN